MRRVNSFAVWLFLCFVLLSQVSLLAGSQSVRVLAYPFPPYLNEDMKTGLTPDVLSLLNHYQNDYNFVLHVVEPQQRYENIVSAKQDMILFEMPQWDWQDKTDHVMFSRLLMKGGEVYITKRTKDRDQSYFDQIKDKHIGAYEGYHYKFADYNSDEAWLKANFDIDLANRHRIIMDWVKQGKVDVGVITLAFLRRYFKDNPNEIAAYLVSQNFAQIYHLKAVLRKNGPISVENFEKILSGIKHTDRFHRLLEKNGILRQWTF
ncbi:conserved exported hypothetical protein [Candidatus Terasakiella magnetica]|uniref:Uncharacterized protein n=1 Tax=Candidatus Terasakiella magnetica TaxID=1867952 RepID=A0A1C3REC2_9PROT|nr:transporter substrate-binding domain-containing protein [Candidatus Terasakiella magnetica]SCA55605.1 conserved exported hypothetical protein [Candidatus Terasakiella magnetica]